MESRIKTIEDITQKTLDYLSVTYSLKQESSDDEIWFNIETSDSNILIGKNGESIRALNFLIQKIVSKVIGEEINFTLDVNGYRKVQRDKIIQKAKMLGERAKNFKVNVRLDPMSSYERLIIHNYFSNDPNIMTESDGEGKNRYVVLKYIDGESNLV